jgi:acetyl-CoA carboxylase biotin carboxyl carrier protein
MSATKEQGEGQTGRRGRSRQPEAAERPSASVNMDELRELVALMIENGLAELELEREEFRVRLRREGTSAAPTYSVETPHQTSTQGAAKPQVSAPAAPSAPAHPGAQATTAASQDQDLHIIPSPIVGTFYRSASPTADAFVKIGSSVEPETVVCIIEAMKLMNEIQAETIGEVAKIYVENGQPVEYGQPLFGIKPQ